MQIYIVSFCSTGGRFLTFSLASVTSLLLSGTSDTHDSSPGFSIYFTALRKSLEVFGYQSLICKTPYDLQVSPSSDPI